MNTPKLFVISGPSGAGKGTLVNCVRERLPHLGLTVSATTRPSRAGEIDGVDYHFMSNEEFTRCICAGEFLEWAEVHGHRYGTLVSEVEEKLSCGQSLILEIDVQGARMVKTRFPEAVLIFIEPPSLDELRRRLDVRASETPASLALRLDDAKQELECVSDYDVRLVNDDLDDACCHLVSILTSYERN